MAEKQLKLSPKIPAGDLTKMSRREILKISEQNFKSWQRALKVGALADLTALYARKVSFLPTLSAKLVQKLEGVRSYFRSFLQKQPVCKIRELKTQVLNAVCYLQAGHYDFRFRQKGQPQTVRARFTFVWHYAARAQGWEILHHHSSKLPGD